MNKQFEYKGHKVRIYLSTLHYMGQYMIEVDGCLPHPGPKTLTEARKTAKRIIDELEETE